MLEMPNNDACEIGLARLFENTDDTNEFAQQLIQYNSQQHKQCQVNGKPKICSGSSATPTAASDDSIDNHNTSQESSKKKLLTFGSTSAQRMSHCIRYRCEQKTKRIQEELMKKYTGTAERLRIRLRLALYKVKTEQQSLSLQQLSEPVRVCQSAQASFCTPKQAVLTARPCDMDLVNRDSVLNVLLTSPQSTEQESASLCFFNQDQSKQVQTQDIDKGTTPTQTSAKTHILMRTPPSIKAARGLLQLRTI